MSSSLAGVILHITSGNENDWNQALRNLSNLYDDESLPIPADMITVVVNGDAVRFLLETAPDAAAISKIAAAGVHINACERSLNRLDLHAGNLAEGVESVSSGVAEVVRLQWNGHGYLKLP